jgi:VWFA-related protein
MKGPITLCFSLLLASSPVLAQDTSAAAPGQPPVFRSGADLVAVDVTVVDDRGKPVAGLTRDDFELEVDGKPRTLASAEFISREAPESMTAQPSEPRVYSSNQGAVVGRLVVLVLDKAHINQGGGAAVVDAANRFLDRLGPADRVGLAIIPNGRHIEFTANREAIREGLKTFHGDARQENYGHRLGLSEALAMEEGNSSTWQEALSRECGSSDPVCPDVLALQATQMVADMRDAYDRTINSLRTLIAGLAPIPGPKSIVLVSEGLATSRIESGMTWLSTATSAAQVNLYALRLDRGLAGDISNSRPTPTLAADEEIRSWGLSQLTSYARGTMFRVVASGDFAFDRIASELSGYYLLGFEPAPGDRDGKSHRINVSLKRKGLTLRARREFIVRELSARRNTADERLTDLLRAPFAAPDIPLKVGTFTFRDQRSPKLRVLISAEIDTTGAPATPIQVASVMFDANGDLVKSSLQRGSVKADEGGPHSRSYLGGVLVDPGTYSLRFAAVDESGRTGSVEHRVDAMLVQAGSLQVGDLVLADDLPREQTATLRPALALDPGVETLGAFVELYGQQSADLEKARVSIDVMKHGSDTALVTSPARLGNVQEVNRRAASGVMSVGLLPPGDYEARAKVSIDDRVVGAVAQSFRIPVRPAGFVAGGRRTAGSMRSMRDAGASPFGFHRDLVLQPSVVASFLNRMESAGHKPAAASVQSALAQARTGRLDEAARSLPPATASAAPGSKEDRTAAAFLRGLAYFSKNDLQNAVAEFRGALAVSSDFFPALFYLGACYAAGGRDTEAAAAWQTSLITESESPIIYKVLADALLRMENPAEAIAVAREAVDLFPRDDELRRRLAVAYLENGQEKDALPLFIEYLDGHPSDADTLAMAIRAIYEAHSTGRAAGTRAEDPKLLARYAKAYADAKGPQQQLVSEWVRFVSEKGRN